MAWACRLTGGRGGGRTIGGMPTIHAPALPTDATWFNVERPLTADDLRGRVVVLDFWTYA
jgi:hypothetical protein